MTVIQSPGVRFQVERECNHPGERNLQGSHLLLHSIPIDDPGWTHSSGQPLS